MNSTRFSHSGSERLYMEVCHYYESLILNRKLPPRSKMPSLRKCAEELNLSRTTIESAYLQLAAEGYIISRPQSGYYVTDIADKQPVLQTTEEKQLSFPYDFASSGVDEESFRFDLWRRYMKSALRQSHRLLSYGEAQGEADLRAALAEYVREQRNVLCSADDIVIGSGMQSLLHILCPLVKDHHTVSFPNSSFLHGCTVFSDYGFHVHFRDKDSDIIYVSPAHMTKWGEIMPVTRRLELISYAAKHQSLIIEDDFENEFVYLQKPTPSLFGLAGGKDVVYLGSFSKLLLPSIRLSFMILPQPIKEAYKERIHTYHQTASKAEQIALCQFIRDGHLASQTRRLKRLYYQKLKELIHTVTEVFGSECQIQKGAGGTSIALTLPFQGSPEILEQKAREQGLRFQILSYTGSSLTLLLSCSSMNTSDFLPACGLLKQLINE